MRDSKPQRCVQDHKWLTVIPNATNRDKNINETSKQILPTICSKYHVITRTVCFAIEKFVSMF